VTAFGIPDADAEMRALSIGDDARMEAWEIAVEQASVEALHALEDRLYRQMELRRSREQPPHIERAALAMIAERRNRAGTGGNRGPMMKD